MKDYPKVSVIIPVFNGEKYLGESIESVLDQTYKVDEIIVVDDGSSDNTKKTALSYGEKVNYFYQINGGPASAMNMGIRKSNSPLLSFLGADDLFTKDKTSRQVKYLVENPHLDLVFGYLEHFASPDVREEVEEKRVVPKVELPGYSQGPMLIWTKSMLQAGYYDDQIKMGEFIEWFARAKDEGLKYELIDGVNYHRRIHTSNWTIKGRDHQNDYLHAVKKAMDRRRNLAESEK